MFLFLIDNSHQWNSKEKSNGTDKVQKWPPPQTSVCVPLPVFGCVVTPLLWCHSLLLPRLVCLLSVCCAQGQSNRAQFFLKKEKSLLSRSEMRWARLEDWPLWALDDPDREDGAVRHSSWCLSISCWSITLCISSYRTKDKEVSKRKTRKFRQSGCITRCKGRFWGDRTDWLSIRYWLQRHHNHLSPLCRSFVCAQYLSKKTIRNDICTNLSFVYEIGQIDTDIDVW